MKFDDLLTNYLGEFGSYQRIQLILVGIPVIFVSMHSLSWTFTAASIPHRCALPDEDTSSTTFYPLHNDEYVRWLKKSKTWAECQRPEKFHLNITVAESELETWKMEECLDGDVWDDSEIKTSAIKKWKFVCKDEWLKSTVHALYYAGQFFGSLLFGIMADKFGRKPVFFIAVGILFFCGTAMAYVPYWQLFAFLRFMLGFAHPAIFITAVVIAVEMLGPSRRILAPVSANVFFALGQIILAGIAYYCRYYHQIQMAISVPAIFFISYYWLLPESARWLITRKKFSQAEKILQNIAKRNETTLPDIWSTELEIDEKKDAPQKRVGFFDMFKTPNVRKHTLALFICWPIVSMAYYGLAMNPSFMGGDRYLSVVLSGSLEVIVSFILLSTVNSVGRKFTGVMGFFLAAICLITSALMPASYGTIRMLFVALGKMCISAVYAVLYLFTPELFPTVIRMTAVGACSMSARLGGFLAAYVFLWLARFYPTPVALSLGVTCFVACCILLYLPDTNGQPQIETINEAEEFAKRNKKLFVFSWNIKENASKNVPVKIQIIGKTEQKS